MSSKTKEIEVIVFSDDWFGLPFSCKHLLQHFLPDVKLIWVETIGIRSPKLNIYDIRRVFQKVASWLFSARTGQKRQLPENLVIINPFLIPYNQIKIIRNINKRALVRAVSSVSSEENRRVMLTTWPFLGDLIGELGEDLSVYYRVDDFSEFPGVCKENIIKLENEIMNKAEMIIASAETLKPDIINKDIKYMAHGVDFEHFYKDKHKVKAGKQLSDVPGPIIGFFGLMNSWLDLEMVKEVADRRPEWSFVFVGPCQMSQAELPTRKNIIFTGAVSYDDLPDYAHCFDVALVPFKINKLTIAVNPLKLMEYFAMGVPVVTTPLPEVIKYEDCVYVATDSDTFEKAVEGALAEQGDELKHKRICLAEERSWKAKSRELQEWFYSAMEKKNV